MPSSSIARIATIAVSVRLPCLTTGCLNALTPLLTASPGHRGATAGERAEQQPQGQRRGDRRRRRWWDDRLRSAAGRERPDHAERDDPHEATDEQVGRQREQPGRVDRTAQVGEREERQEREAELEQMRMKRGHGRDQGAHARRDSHRDVQHVIDHERRRSDQARVRAEVDLRDRIGASVVRIGLDRLAVRGVQDRQEHHDRGDDRADVREPGGAQREQDGQRGLGPVGRRAQAIEPHRRHAFERADLALRLLPVGQRSAEQQPVQRHRPTRCKSLSTTAVAGSCRRRWHVDRNGSPAWMFVAAVTRRPLRRSRST
jgi:hypothetical protein